MRFMETAKDGGPDSHVTGLFLVEIKSLFSIVLLRFAKGTREVYHSHAFNALTLWLKGDVVEELPNGDRAFWRPGMLKFTPRNLVHRVRALVDTYAISIRGPWVDTWKECKENYEELKTLTHGRVEVKGVK